MSSRAQTFLGGETPSAVARGALTAAGFELAERQQERRVLLDTFDGRLHDAGLRLEHRVAERTEQLVLADGGSAPVSLVARSAPRLPADLAAGPFRSRIASATNGRALLPIRAVVGRSTAIVLCNGSGKTVASATMFEGLSVDGRPMGWAIEVTDLCGYERGADRLGDVLRDCGLTSVGADLFGLAGPAAAPGRATASPTVPLDPAAPAGAAFRRVLEHLLTTIEANLPGTIDDLDAEFLHELRVAVRRSRSVLAYSKGVLPADELTRARAELAWLGSITGRPRDLDVYQLEWPDYVGHLPADVRDDLEAIRSHLDQQRRTAHAELESELRGDRAGELLRWWRDALTSPTTTDGAPVGKAVRRRIRRAHRRLVERGRAIDDSSPAEAVHELRKDAKRLRYLLECFGGLYPAKRRRAFVARLKALQDNLGNHQDADVHAHHLRALTAQLDGQLPVGTVLAAGQLIEQLDQRRAATRADFAARFADFDSAATQAALDELLAGGAR